MPLDPLTIISAVVAILVIWKLRSVLGERTGLEKPPTNPFVDRKPEAPRPSPQVAHDGVVRLPGAAQSPRAPDAARWRPYAEPGSATVTGLDAIAAADPAFAVGPFIEGAKIAYEAVITAFAAGERKSLQSLLAKDVYDSFNTAITERESRGDKLTTTFVSMDDAKIEEAGVEGRTARISVRFASKQISATHSADGKVVDGNTDHVVEMDDIWTFARDVTSRDPNWKLVATQSGG